MRNRHGAFFFACVLTWVSFGACSGDRDVSGTKNPHPPTGGPGSGGAGGGGGAEEVYSVCACILSALGDDGTTSFVCSDCIGMTVQSGGACDLVDEECDQDPECAAIIECVAACDMDDASSVDCVAACALPRDRNAATMRYHDRLDCFCMSCEYECNSFGEPTCPVVEDVGGMGGMGGAGGA